MKRVAKFEKVSYEEFKKSITDFYYDNFEIVLKENEIQKFYDDIKLPKRATMASAGYDFFNNTGVNLVITKGETYKIPTGIRCEMYFDWVLVIAPRSGLGFKYRLQLDNSLGIIDADYAYSDNEGHIFLKVTNDSKFEKTCTIEQKKAFVQGIFLPYGITEDDDVKEIRNGGFGSTGE